MTFQYMAEDPLDAEIDSLLARVAAGEAPRALESKRIDFKEEPGRRLSGGAIRAGQTQSRVAAESLMPEVACLANTPGGGALVVGIADDGTRIGTELDPEWLRHALYTMSDRQVTADVRAATFDQTRLLILRVPEALEPVRHRNRLHWRVDDHCVEVDPASWWEGRLPPTGTRLVGTTEHVRR